MAAARQKQTSRTQLIDQLEAQVVQLRAQEALQTACRGALASKESLLLRWCDGLLAVRQAVQARLGDANGPNERLARLLADEQHLLESLPAHPGEVPVADVNAVARFQSLLASAPISEMRDATPAAIRERMRDALLDASMQANALPVTAAMHALSLHNAPHLAAETQDPEDELQEAWDRVFEIMIALAVAGRSDELSRLTLHDFRRRTLHADTPAATAAAANRAAGALPFLGLDPELVLEAKAAGLLLHSQLARLRVVIQGLVPANPADGGDEGGWALQPDALQSLGVVMRKACTLHLIGLATFAVGLSGKQLATAVGLHRHLTLWLDPLLLAIKQQGGLILTASQQLQLHWIQQAYQQLQQQVAA